MKFYKVSTIVLVMLLVASITGCSAAFVESKKEDNKDLLKKTPYVSAKIVAPEGFDKGAPVTENTLLEFYKGSSGINLSRSYMGKNESLDEYVKDSKERLEDDIYNFMEFTFVSTEGIIYQGEDKRVIAFEALQNRVHKKFWIVYVQYDEYVFEITCYAPKDEFGSLENGFNNTIVSFEILK